jgi:NADH-quinone oxidoreductase subunit M
MLVDLVVFLPLAGALLVLLVPPEERFVARALGFGTALVTALVSLGVLARFDAAEPGFQLEHKVEWIRSIGASYHVGVDGISLWLVMLTTLLTPVVFLSTWSSIDRRVKEFVAAMLVLETGMLGAFVAQDLFLFYVFWEIMLVPMYLIIGIWGGERRLYASIKFVLYTMVGSLLMLVAIFYLYVKHHDLTGTWSFAYADLMRVVLSHDAQVWCFLAFGLAFAIKVPLFPLHTWLPDAHVEAPTAGSVILAGVMLKLGTYGFLRYAMPLFPGAAVSLTPYIAGLAVIGIVYGALVAYPQPDVKKLIAYSSVSHLGFVVLGTFTASVRGIEGGLFTMLAHGVSTGGLFLAIGAIYDRRHTRLIDDFGGLWATIPVFSAVFLVICLSSIGVPGLNGFVGEFLILSGTFADGTFPYARTFAAVGATVLVLGAVYMLTMYQRVIFGPVTRPENANLKDLSLREICVFAPVLIAIFAMGIYPKPILRRMDASVARLVAEYERKQAASLTVGEGAAVMLPAAAPAAEPSPAPSAPPPPEGAAPSQLPIM